MSAGRESRPDEAGEAAVLQVEQAGLGVGLPVVGRLVDPHRGVARGRGGPRPAPPGRARRRRGPGIGRVGSSAGRRRAGRRAAGAGRRTGRCRRSGQGSRRDGGGAVGGASGHSGGPRRVVTGPWSPARPRKSGARSPVGRTRPRYVSVRMFVFGVDPGVSRCGYCVLERARSRARCRSALGVLRTSPARSAARRAWPSSSASCGRCSSSSRPRCSPSSRCSSRSTCAPPCRSARPSGIAMAEAVVAPAPRSCSTRPTR